MAKLERSFFDIDSLETLSNQKTVVHKLDARIKIITTLVFIIVVLSFNKYDLSGLLPFFIYPAFLLNAGNIPISVILKKIIVLSPFIIIIGIFNPFLDHAELYKIGRMSISGGWISFLSIIIRFLLTVSISFILISITGFYQICFGLNKIGVPAVFSLQLMLMYRYIFLLIEESIRLVRAHNLRAFDNKIKFRHYIYMISYLLIRTIDRAESIYNAMLARGFDGRLKIITGNKIGFKDIFFLVFWASFFVFFRLYNAGEYLGQFFVG